MSRKISAADPIDFVIPWVDGNDPLWQKQKAEYKPPSSEHSDAPVRYRDWDNLNYWFRGVEKFAPWVNRIYFITWGHFPKWLNRQHPKLCIVNHRDYIPEKYLPTFSSHTIELNIHRIEGLSEHFVYFNDDMFITRPMQPQDFFKDGLPCDCFGLNCIYFGHDSAGHFNGSNLEVINTEFKNKKAIMKRDFGKWFSPKNGIRKIIKTICLLPWEWFPGFNYNHLPTSFRRETFEEVWDKYPEVLDKTCCDRFRTESNVNQWLMKYWQLCTGKYAVRSDSVGEVFHIEEKNFGDLCKALSTQKYKMICINDTPRTIDFEAKKQKVLEIFESILPEKSAFEI